MIKGRLQKIINDIALVKVAVVGDFCLDAYWFIDETMSEISIETNQPTRPVADQRYTLGGAGNVTSNLAAMGIKDVRAFGVIGTDPFGTEMIRIMRETGINPDNLLVQQKDWSTHTYAKPYIGDSELSRVDFGNYNQLSMAVADQLISKLSSVIPYVDIIIINQQVPSGIHTEYFRNSLLKVIGQFPEKIFITDSRNYNDFYNGTIRKMNDTEAVRLCGIIRKPDEAVPYSEIISAANELYKKYHNPLFITRGRLGSLTVDETGISEIPGLMIIAKVDTVGAGDSYLAGAAATMAAGYNLAEAAELGAYVAGVTVQKLFQTGTASPEEILAIGTDPDFIYNSALADDQRNAVYLEKTEIEIINKWKEKPRIKYAIFDHDGTISTLREGWESIMAPVMIEAILGDKYFKADKTLYDKVKTRVDEYIDMTTGIQTLVQMKGLPRLIKEFNYVPESLILDEFGYKRIFNEQLLEMVYAREKKLLQGELSVDDFTIKNVIPFLQKLYDSGISLYLVSGTDEEDVKREARTLGYEALFGGRIFGATGDSLVEAKKIVLDRLFGSIGDDSSGKIVTFGDGPVEMRETKKRGGMTVGIASNELRRYGLNMKKRTRLIKAGADIVVPDFSQYQHLSRLLNI